MKQVLCPGCNRNVEPKEKVEKDRKTKKNWAIKYCPYERCGFNLDIVPFNVKVWNNDYSRFEDFDSGA